MGFKRKCSLPHADLSWSPLVTSVSIYTRNNNKKSAALANMGNQHIMVCVTAVRLYIPRGGDEKAAGCSPRAQLLQRAGTRRCPYCPTGARACGQPTTTCSRASGQWSWYHAPCAAKRALALHVSFWLGAGRSEGHTDLLPFMLVTGQPSQLADISQSHLDN